MTYCSRVKKMIKLNLFEFRKLCRRFPWFLRYVEETILDTDKERCVSAWTDRVMHLSNTTTNIVEGAHGRLKGYLTSRQFKIYNFTKTYI
jgi:hypothetical protein